MNSDVQVTVVRGRISSIDAVGLVSALTGDEDAVLASEVLYPYYRFEAHGSIPTLAGGKHVSLACLVDAVNGLGATSDHFDVSQETVPAAQRLAVQLDRQAAGKIARRTATHHIGRKLRMIAAFNVSIVARGLLYKRFWIVQSTNARVMVDSTSGSLHPLKQRAA